MTRPVRVLALVGERGCIHEADSGLSACGDTHEANPGVEHFRGNIQAR